jgi:hypothetical protein
VPYIPTNEWQTIETAPEGEDLMLEVVGIEGEPYTLPFACKRSGSAFITAKGSRLQVRPVRWRTFFPPYVGTTPKKKQVVFPVQHGQD